MPSSGDTIDLRRYTRVSWPVIYEIHNMKYILNQSIVFFVFFLYLTYWIHDFYHHNVPPKAYAKILWIDISPVFYFVNIKEPDSLFYIVLRRTSLTPDAWTTASPRNRSGVQRDHQREPAQNNRGKSPILWIMMSSDDDIIIRKNMIWDGQL
jgi:hypothetical protein